MHGTKESRDREEILFPKEKQTVKWWEDTASPSTAQVSSITTVGNKILAL